MLTTIWLTTTWVGVILLGGWLLTWLLIPWVLLKRTVDPAAAVAWIMAIVFIPYVGAILCLIFGANWVERRKARKRLARRHIQRILDTAARDRSVVPREFTPLQRQLLDLTDGMTDRRLTFGNRVELLPMTERAFERLEQAIAAARDTVHVQFYIWRPDRIGTRMRDLLIRKAREGVTVRFLYDGIGSMHLGRRFLRPMFEAGIQVHPFLPGPGFRERWSINLRNHRKVVIVDGRVGFTGGMNVGDEYLGRSPHFGFWRDTQLELRGPAVLQLQQVFAEDWYYATQEGLTHPDLFPQPDEQGDVAAQVLSGGPDTETNIFYSLMYAAINEAREQVTLATSYFVPPTPLSMALETAARRGVRVRVLVAKKATYLWTLLAGRSYYDDLLEAGVEVYEYHKGLFHAKTLTVDGSWSLVGTPNFDMRSLMLNFEVAVALYDERLSSELERHFEEDLKDATCIDPEQWSRRSVWKQLGERFWRLFAPVL
jgi:cardiolipin synthase A/B